MRDIVDYERNYLSDDFEELQVVYRQRKMKELFCGNEKLKILEIGCGLNSFCNCIDHYKAYTIVEPGNAFLEETKRQLKNKRVNFVNGLFEERVEVLSHESYDLIILSGLLHEVEQPEQLLRGVVKLSDKNTTVHINVPNAKSFHRILAKSAGLIPDLYEPSARNILLQQNRIFDLDSLKRLCVESGFSIVDSGSYFIKPFTHKQMSQLLGSGIISEHVLDGFYNMIDYLPEYGSEIYVNLQITPGNV